MPLPCVLKSLDSVRCENKVQVEWSVVKLNEVFPSFDVGSLTFGQTEPQFAQRGDESPPVFRFTFDEQVGILSRVGKSE